MAKKVHPVIIGTFVVSSILLFILSLIVFSSGNIFSHNVKFYTFFDASLNGLDIGAPVKFKGVRVGSVEAIDIVYDNESDEACASVLIKINSDAFKTVNGRHVVVNNYDEFYAEQIARGMAAKLSLESVVTGKNFVAIDYYPQSSERYFKDIDGLKYQQMPSMTMDLDEFLASVDSVMKNLSKLDLESITDNLNSTLRKVTQALDDFNFKRVGDSFAESCENVSKIMRDEKVYKILDAVCIAFNKFNNRFDGTMDDVSGAMNGISSMLKSGTYFRENLENSLLQFEKMLRSIREFFDFLERNPNAILAGKSL